MFPLTSRRFCRSLSRSLRILCCSARSERRFSCRITHITTLTAVIVISSYDVIGQHCTYNPVCKTDEFLLLLLTAFKVSFYQRLELIQVLLHTLAMDVLRGGKHLTFEIVSGTVFLIKCASSGRQKHKSKAQVSVIGI